MEMGPARSSPAGLRARDGAGRAPGSVRPWDFLPGVVWVVQVRLSRLLRRRPALRSFLPTSAPASLTAPLADLTGWATFLGISSCTDVVNIFRARNSSGMPTG